MTRKMTTAAQRQKSSALTAVLTRITATAISLLLLLVGQTEGLQWTKIPKSQEVRPGETLTLECALQDQTQQLIWIKRDSVQVKTRLY